MKIEKLINNIKKFKDTLKIKEKRLDLQEKYLVKLKEEEIKKDFYVFFDFFGSYFLLPSLIFWLIKGDFSGFSYLFMFLIILSPVGMMNGLLEPFGLIKKIFKYKKIKNKLLKLGYKNNELTEEFSIYLINNKWKKESQKIIIEEFSELSDKEKKDFLNINYNYDIKKYIKEEMCNSIKKDLKYYLKENEKEEIIKDKNDLIKIFEDNELSEIKDYVYRLIDEKINKKEEEVIEEKELKIQDLFKEKTKSEVIIQKI